MRFFHYTFFILYTCLASQLLFAREKYSLADTRAYNVPNYLSHDLNELTDYLIRPFEHNELQKVRVIFAWISYHIQYDDYEYRTSYESRSNRPHTNCIPTHDNYVDCYKDTPFDTFEKRSGVCRHFAKLFTYMARRAGLNTVVVNGYAFGGDHAWNAVQISQKWHLLDVTSHHKIFNNIKNDEEYLNAIQKRKNNFNQTNKSTQSRKIDERYFLLPPKEMIKTHFPDQNKWQLLEQPISALSYLKKNPELKDSPSFMKMIKKEQQRAYLKKSKASSKKNNTSMNKDKKYKKRRQFTQNTIKEKTIVSFTQKDVLLLNKNEKDFQKVISLIEKEIDQIPDKEVRSQAVSYWKFLLQLSQ